MMCTRDGERNKWWFLSIGAVFLVAAIMVFVRVIPSADQVLEMGCVQAITEPCAQNNGGEAKARKGDEAEQHPANPAPASKGDEKRAEGTTYWCWPKVAVLLVTVLGGLGILGLVGYQVKEILRLVAEY